MHQAECARLAAVDFWSKAVFVALGTVAGSTQLSTTLQFSGSVQLSATLLLLLSMAHALINALGFLAASSANAALASAWLDVYTTLQGQLELERSARVPLAAFLTYVRKQYNSLRARSGQLLTAGALASFAAVLQRNDARKRALGMSVGCGCANEGVRVPVELGGRLTHTRVCRTDGHATAEPASVLLPLQQPAPPAASAPVSVPVSVPATASSIAAATAAAAAASAAVAVSW